MMENSLIVVENLDVTIVFSEKGMTKLLGEIETKAIAHVSDISTDQGRKDIASLAYKVTRSKTLIDNLGKDVVSDWKKKAKAIDAHRKIARDFLDNLKDKVRQPLTEWEAAEAVIKAEEETKEKVKIETRVSELFALGVNVPFFDLAMLSDNEYAEKLQSAKVAYHAEQLRLDEEEKRLEEERLELARLREKEETDRKLEGERLEKLAKEQKVEADRLAKIQADIDAKEKALKDEKDKLEADKKSEQARKDLEILEAKLAEEARIKAEQNEIERAAREAKELKEKEEAEAAEKARQAELLPDKTKLLNFADLIHVLASGNFSMKSVEAQALYAATLCTISDLETTFRKKVKEL